MSKLVKQPNRLWRSIIPTLFTSIALIFLSLTTSYQWNLLPTSLLSSKSLFLRTPFSPLSSTFQTPSSHSPSIPLSTWIETQESLSWKYLLSNIHPEGTVKGCIVASPSKELPHYWFQWTRDSALVMRNLVNVHTRGVRVYEDLILDYISATEEIQHKDTRSGGFSTGGLGEVKYLVNNEPFEGEWGRPQHDGPASRAITIINFALYQLEIGTELEKDFVRRKLYDSQFPSESIIKGDLEHIAHRWNDAGFDLWEEVSASHFYTLLTIQKALTLGAQLAHLLSDPGAASYYTTISHHIETVLKEFWSESKGIIRVSLNHTNILNSDGDIGVGKGGKESELDSAILLAVLHSGRGSNWEGSDMVLATLDKLMISMGILYPLNHNKTVPALGRYPEDIYDGIGTSIANPWFICTLAAAETLYLSTRQLSTRIIPLEITSISLNFYSRFLPNLNVGNQIEPGSQEMRELLKGQRELADGFMNVVREFTGDEGRMSEQFDRVTGVPRGARDLTWSYAAFITAAEARRGNS